MRFKLEHEMCAPVEKWLQSKGLMVKREFSTPWGICDLVACSINKKKAVERLKLGQRRSIGPPFRILLLNLIPDQKEEESIKCDDLCRQFEGIIDKTRIQAEIDRLYKDKFVALTPEGAFQKINGWMPLHKKLVAVELKLDKVNEALNQAINNLEFVEESYVGLPMETAKKILRGRKIEDFQKDGIGILGVTPSICRVLRKADKDINCRKNDVLQKHAVERFWRTYSISTNIAS